MQLKHPTKKGKKGYNRLEE